MMYVDIDSNNMISIHNMTEEEALNLHQAIQNTYINYPDAEVKSRMLSLGNELLIHFKTACKNGGSKKI